MKNPFTQAGFDKLMAERDELSRVTRPKVVRGITEAAAEGDRSENAEYIYGKKHLREIDKRLAYLGTILKDAQVIASPVSPDKVSFACTVVVNDENGELRKWKIVGDGEADNRDGTISYKSPVARALLNKRVGDVVEIDRPKGKCEFEVVDIL